MLHHSFALTHCRIFDGITEIAENCIQIENGRIVRLCTIDQLPASAATLNCQNRLITPGFIDTQINGAGGILFNDHPTADAIKTISNHQRRFGTTSFLPTLISPSRELIRRAQQSVENSVDQGSSGCIGIHIEGPFLNSDKRGVHPEDQILQFTQADIHLLSEAGLKTLLTLAPEAVTTEDIHALHEANILVSLGHSNADYPSVINALAAGARGFTHLFNAMSPMTSREPGMVGAALLDLDSWCGVIMDGHHVHPASLQVALKAKTQGKIFWVTDAVHISGADQVTLDLLGQTIQQENGKVTTLDGTLAGSALTMIEAVRNGIELLGLSRDESLRMASRYPAAFLAMDDELGLIKPGYRANLLALDSALRVTDSWINGEHRAH